MSGYDAVLFDFDGVLIDSEPVHWRCWAEVLSPLGIMLDWDTYRTNCIGVADIDMLRFLASLSAEPIDPELTLRQYYPVKKENFRRRMEVEGRLAPGVDGLIESLRGTYRLAVVTSSGRSEVEPMLERAGILPMLDGAVYGGDVARHKPAPDPYLKAAGIVGAVSPLVVEDSAAGVQSATAAGFDVVRVANPAETVAATRTRLNQKTNRTPN